MKLDIKILIKRDTNDTNYVLGNLIGQITEIGELPTDKQLKRSSSFLYGRGCNCRDENCSLTRNGTRAQLLAMYHSLHGHEVRGVVSLTDRYEKHDPLKNFFRGAKKKYKVTLRLDDDKVNMVSRSRFVFFYLSKLALLTPSFNFQS
jgi:hypothetical protein